MSYHENYQAKQYDQGSICGCGRPSRHASGNCWDCYETKFNKDHLNDLKDHLKSIDMWRGDDESVKEWQRRCKEFLSLIHI